MTRLIINTHTRAAYPNASHLHTMFLLGPPTAAHVIKHEQSMKKPIIMKANVLSIANPFLVYVIVSTK